MSAIIFNFIFLSLFPLVALSNVCESYYHKTPVAHVDLSVRKNKWSDYKQHVIEKNRLFPLWIAGKLMWIYDNANVSVNVTHACNAKCGFCVDALEKKDAVEPAGSKVSRDQYSEQFDRTMKTLKDANVTVSVTGGEPTLDARRLAGILKTMNDHGIKKRVLTTNGSLLLAPAKGFEEKRTIDLIAEYGLEHMNISRAHYDDTINDDIMMMKPHFSNRQLEDAVKEAKKAGIRVRLSLAILKEGVNDINGIRNYLDWAKSIGVEDVIVRQLMEIDLGEMKQNWVSDFYHKEGRTIKLDDLLISVDQDPNFHLVKQHVGYYYYSEVYTYKGVNVVFNMADLTLLDQPETSQPTYDGKRIVYEMIFQDNGSLEGTWESGKDVLIPAPNAYSPIRFYSTAKK
ncbi:MAG: radical SAM protein [Bdellovibrionaceae bacterium]|nr:radical SAM protein [Pseudobdellovibrionaceae bacterium]